VYIVLYIVLSMVLFLVLWRQALGHRAQQVPRLQDLKARECTRQAAHRGTPGPAQAQAHAQAQAQTHAQAQTQTQAQAQAEAQAQAQAEAQAQAQAEAHAQAHAQAQAQAQAHAQAQTQAQAEAQAPAGEGHGSRPGPEGQGAQGREGAARQRQAQGGARASRGRGGVTVVVGSGPAGLFAALGLAEAGERVVLLERGRPVEVRGRDIGAFAHRRILDPESNFCYGEVRAKGGRILARKAAYCRLYRALSFSLPPSPLSLSIPCLSVCPSLRALPLQHLIPLLPCLLRCTQGGAGTWSDGKLTTRIGRTPGTPCRSLRPLVALGAPERILVDGASPTWGLTGWSIY